LRKFTLVAVPLPMIAPAPAATAAPRSFHTCSGPGDEIITPAGRRGLGRRGMFHRRSPPPPAPSEPGGRICSGRPGPLTPKARVFWRPCLPGTGHHARPNPGQCRRVNCRRRPAVTLRAAVRIRRPAAPRPPPRPPAVEGRNRGWIDEFSRRRRPTGAENGGAPEPTCRPRRRPPTTLIPAACVPNRPPGRYQWTPWKGVADR